MPGGFFAGFCATIQEPASISQADSMEVVDGCVVGLWDHLNQLLTGVYIFDSRKDSSYFITVINKSIKLRLGLHSTLLSVAEFHRRWHRRTIELGTVNLVGFS